MLYQNNLMVYISMILLVLLALCSERRSNQDTGMVRLFPFFRQLWVELAQGTEMCPEMDPFDSP